MIFCFYDFSIRISNATFESSRLLVILFVLMLRFVLFRKYLQSYLNIAPQKISYLKRQTGKMTNIDVQKLVKILC